MRDLDKVSFLNGTSKSTTDLDYSIGRTFARAKFLPVWISQQGRPFCFDSLAAFVRDTGGFQSIHELAVVPICVSRNLHGHFVQKLGKKLASFRQFESMF